MERHKLVREKSKSSGTFGVLTYGNSSLFSIELPWRDNKRGASSIPKGIYSLSWFASGRFRKAGPRVIRLRSPEQGIYHDEIDLRENKATAVGRTYILIHPANYSHELLGCIALGLRRDKAGVYDSVLACKKYFAYLKTLEIKNVELEITDEDS